MTDLQDPAEVADFPRDRWERPLIIPADGGNPVPYVRASSAAKTVEDTYNLELWARRNVVYGMTYDETLALRVRAVGGTPKTWDKAKRDEIDKIRQAAEDEAKARAGADIGTALHRMTERLDRGETVDAGPCQPDLEAYTGALERAGLEVVEVECRMVCDSLLMAGTADRIVRTTDGLHRILDLKGLALDTLLPTPTGWTTMGAVAVGDRVIGSDGHPCTVTAKSDVHWKRCRRVVFDDGTAVIADDDHRWLVDVGRSRESRTVVMTTGQIAACPDLIRVFNAAPLELPDVDLPIDPYVLGCWLGDGNRGSGQVTKPRDVGMWVEIERRGYTLGVEQLDKRTGCCTRTVRGLVTQLRAMGLLGDKHIPAAYLRASHRQRLDLLRGLMDTDGTTNKARRRRAVFGSTDKALALAVYELVVSLGERAHLSETTQTGFGLTVQSHNVEWAPLLANPFATEPKCLLADVRDTGMNGRRMIMSAEPVPTVPTQCIAVDSPDHTYLCTESMVPTHNTGATVDYGGLGWAAQLAAYAHGSLYDPVVGVRLDTPALDRSVGYIAHLPAGRGECTLYEIDLVAGHRAAELANEIRAVRRDARRWITPLALPAPEPTAGELHALLGRGHDEGGPVAAERFAELEARYFTLGPAGHAWFGQIIHEAKQAGVAFHAHTERTERRYHLYRGLIWLGEMGAADAEAVRALVSLVTDSDAPLFLTVTVGHAVGSMGASEAEAFATACDDLVEGRLVADYGDPVGMRLRPT